MPDDLIFGFLNQDILQSDLSVSGSISPSQSACSCRTCIPTHIPPDIKSSILDFHVTSAHLFPGHGAVPVILHIALDTLHTHQFLSKSTFIFLTLLNIVTCTEDLSPASRHPDDLHPDMSQSKILSTKSDDKKCTTLKNNRSKYLPIMSSPEPFSIQLGNLQLAASLCYTCSSQKCLVTGDTEKVSETFHLHDFFN